MAPIDNRKNEAKERIKIFNFMGNEVERNFKGFLIRIF
jgi:hypothetical protein